jgi:hypothetical protein
VFINGVHDTFAYCRYPHFPKYPEVSVSYGLTMILFKINVLLIV